MEPAGFDPRGLHAFSGPAALGRRPRCSIARNGGLRSRLVDTGRPLLHIPRVVDLERADRRRWILILGALTALGPLAIDAYLPSLPAIQRALATTSGAVELTLSAYFLGLAGGQLLWGPIADRLGRKTPLTIGLALYTLGSLAAAASPRIELLIAARALQAIGGSAGVVVVRAIVRDRWAGREGARMMSWIVLVMGAAPILAPTLGGLLLAVSSWRVIFVVLACAGLVALFAVWRFLPETQAVARPEPMRDAVSRVVRDRRFVAYGLAASFSNAGMFAYIAGSPFVYIEMLHLSPSAYAVIFGANAAGYVAASQLNRRLLALRDHTTIALVASLVTAAIGAALVALSWTGNVGLLSLGALVLAYVASLGFAGANATAAALEEQAARAGLASAFLGSTQFTIASLASAAVGVLADGTARPMTSLMLACASLAVICVRIGRTTDAKAP